MLPPSSVHLDQPNTLTRGAINATHHALHSYTETRAHTLPVKGEARDGLALLRTYGFLDDRERPHRTIGTNYNIIAVIPAALQVFFRARLPNVKNKAALQKVNRIIFMLFDLCSDFETRFLIDSDSCGSKTWEYVDIKRNSKIDR